MAAPPRTHYAKSGRVNIAYQVLGEGPLDLVWTFGWVSHIELAWENAAITRFFHRLASFGRLIVFDKRGTGLSDAVPVDQLPTLEQRMDDGRAVMDATGSETAALLGLSEGGPMDLLFAATYPNRTRALVIISSFTRLAWATDYEFGTDSHAFEQFLERLERKWGTGFGFRALFPGQADDEAMRQWWARYQRLAASPGTSVALQRMVFATDARSVLPTIQVPTLVLHRTGDRFVPVAHGRYIAEHIPGDRFVELGGADHLPFLGDSETVLGKIQEFLTGTRDRVEPDRGLVTVLFTDIVGSAERVAQLGDQPWRELLEGYYELARRELTRFRGREIDTAGDGLFASFDDPARVVRCAEAISKGVRSLGIEIRAGLHTGECEVIGGKVGGIAVHIGARVACSREQTRSSCPAPSRTSSSARVSASRSGAPTRSKACPANGDSTRRREPVELPRWHPARVAAVPSPVVELLHFLPLVLSPAAGSSAVRRAGQPLPEAVRVAYPPDAVHIHFLLSRHLLALKHL